MTMLIIFLSLFAGYILGALTIALLVVAADPGPAPTPKLRLVTISGTRDAYRCRGCAPRGDPPQDRPDHDPLVDEPLCSKCLGMGPKGNPDDDDDGSDPCPICSKCLGMGPKGNPDDDDDGSDPCPICGNEREWVGPRGNPGQCDDGYIDAIENRLVRCGLSAALIANILDIKWDQAANLITCMAKMG